ncbi:MAG: hypothetical protein ABWZ15_16715, partial [Acidimicrobiia bacterium]
MKRFVALSSISVIAVLGLTPGVADAGQPANRACVGTTDSALATTQPFPGAFGGGVRGFAQDPTTRPGLGDGIQALQAGVVPDD